jgi:glycosyltransferase involved in cell wall biosynthesis
LPPLISVVVPVRDRERYLGEAIASLLHEGWLDLEVVVVDDGSTDRSAEVAASYSGVRCLRRERRGAAAARNTGVGAARGDLLGFLDSDDLRVAGTLERQVEVLTRRPGVDLVFGHVTQFLSPELGPEERRLLRTDDRPRAGYLAGAMLVRRSAMAAVGAFDETLRAGELVDWLARARDRGLLTELIPEVVLRRRVHRDHLSSQLDARRDFARVVKANLDRRRARPEGR